MTFKKVINISAYDSVIFQHMYITFNPNLLLDCELHTSITGFTFSDLGSWKYLYLLSFELVANWRSVID